MTIRLTPDHAGTLLERVRDTTPLIECPPNTMVTTFTARVRRWALTVPGGSRALAPCRVSPSVVSDLVTLFRCAVPGQRK